MELLGASDYASAHANTNKSTILTNLEAWYEKNNLKNYEKVIADTVWCNDKTNVTDTSYDPWSITPNGLGYAKNVTYYGAIQRLVGTSGSAGGTGPSLKCNGELSKINSKVGLITADELALAGYAYGYKIIQQHIYKKMLQILIGGPCLLTASVVATLAFGALAAVAASAASAWTTLAAFVLQFLLSRRPT